MTLHVDHAPINYPTCLYVDEDGDVWLVLRTGLVTEKVLDELRWALAHVPVAPEPLHTVDWLLDQLADE